MEGAVGVFGVNSGAVQVKELYAFNPNYGNDTDDEMGKVLYYYPGDTSEDNQLRKVGLSTAIIQFAENFNTTVPCESLHTSKARYVFYQPEPGFWFTMVLSVPSIRKVTPDGVDCTEYLNEEVQDNVFQSVIARLYEKFILLNDKLDAIVQKKGLLEVKSRLKKYFDSWVQRIDANQAGVTDIFQGLQFLPLNRQMFLRVQCFLNSFTVAWPQCKYIVLMHREKLIWSGVDQRHIQLFYDYLVNELLSQHFLSGADKQSTYGLIFKRESHVTFHFDETDGNKMPSGLSVLNNNNTRSSNSLTGSHLEEETDSHSSFMTASTTTVDGREDARHRFHMMIYKAEQTYLTMLLPDSVEFDRQLQTKMEAFLNLNFTPLARELAKDNGSFKGSSSHSSPSGFSSILGSSSSSSADAPPNVKYLYFNNLNFAEKLSPGYQCDLESYKLLADLKSDLSQMNENGEIIAKMVSENWIVAKVSNRREFYAILNQKNSNLLDVDEEMRKLTETHLTNIFFQE